MCGYRRRGLPGDGRPCPECGAPANWPASRIARYAPALFVTSAAFGSGAVLLIWMAYEMDSRSQLVQGMALLAVPAAALGWAWTQDRRSKRSKERSKDIHLLEKQEE